MSSGKKLRRKWKCRKCGEKMHAQLAKPAKKIADKVVKNKLLHICGSCKAIHVSDYGVLRLLTKAEEFKVRMEIPNTLARIEQTVYEPKANPTAVLDFGAD